MSEHLYACVHADEFPAQALLRLRADLQPQAVVVLDGQPPVLTVCSMNRHARLKGAAIGMTRLEAESIDGLHLLTRSPETETAASAVMMECAARFSPRLECVRAGISCACVLDITGTERLFGPSLTLAERIRAALAAAGLRTSIAVSRNFDTARLKAAAVHGVTVIPDGSEAVALSKLPLSALELEADYVQTFATWGVRTMAELAALPESELIARLGLRARAWRNMARGRAAHTFQPVEEAFLLEEFCAFETAVEQVDSLLFVGARMVDCLVARAAARALSLTSLTVAMKLDGSQAYERIVRPALATVDRKFLLKLLQLELAAHPPQAAVQSLTLSAQAGQSSKVQLGLFSPQTPEPSRLDVTIARLKAIAGEDRVGSPVLQDTHRPGSFRMDGFALHQQLNKAGELAPVSTRMALRRLRPPAQLRVAMKDQKPISFRDRQQSYRISAAYGPWKTSGNWWSPDAWNAEEWDVLAEPETGASIACLLVRDCSLDRWQLEAMYD
jgi:protein ImuB